MFTFLAKIMESSNLVSRVVTLALVTTVPGYYST